MPCQDSVGRLIWRCLFLRQKEELKAKRQKASARMMELAIRIVSIKHSMSPEQWEAAMVSLLDGSHPACKNMKTDAKDRERVFTHAKFDKPSLLRVKAGVNDLSRILMVAEVRFDTGLVHFCFQLHERCILCFATGRCQHFEFELRCEPRRMP